MDFKKVIENTKSIVLFIAFLYFVLFLDHFINFPINALGIIPRTKQGLIGIITMPFLHANLGHLMANTVPLFVLLNFLVNFYEKKAMPVILIVIFLGGALVWLFGREANHVGASGLIYGLAGFLISYGILSKKAVPIIISIVIGLAYGGLVFGFIPQGNVSWEGHLFGAIAGVIAAFLLKEKKL